MTYVSLPCMLPIAVVLPSCCQTNDFDQSGLAILVLLLLLLILLLILSAIMALRS